MLLCSDDFKFIDIVTKSDLRHDLNTQNYLFTKFRNNLFMVESKELFPVTIF